MVSQPKTLHDQGYDHSREILKQGDLFFLFFFTICVLNACSKTAAHQVTSNTLPLDSFQFLEKKRSFVLKTCQ